MTEVPRFDKATIRSRIAPLVDEKNWRLRKDILVPQILMRQGKLFGGQTMVNFPGGAKPVEERIAVGVQFTPAAVLVPLIEHAEGTTVLLTERTSKLTKHAGEVAFPGGRAEPTDGSVEATALREAQEEIGLDPAKVEILGRLAHYVTGSGFEVTPVVGVVKPPLNLLPDPHEVASIFEVPLAFFLDAANHRREMTEVNGFMRVYYVMPFGERRIWGTTAAILVNFYDALMHEPEALRA